MMKRLFDIYFIFYCLLWIAIKTTRHIGMPMPVVNSFATDFIAVPTVAHISMLITATYIIKDAGYTYNLFYLAFIAAYISVVFECIMPHFSTKYTADILDIPCYFLGALFYYTVHLRNYKSNFAGTLKKTTNN